MLTFLIRFDTSQSSSYPIVLTRLGGPRSRPNPLLKFGSTGNQTHDLMGSSQTPWPLWGGRWSINYHYKMLGKWMFTSHNEHQPASCHELRNWEIGDKIEISQEIPKCKWTSLRLETFPVLVTDCAWSGYQPGCLKLQLLAILLSDFHPKYVLVVMGPCIKFPFAIGVYPLQPIEDIWSNEEFYIGSFSTRIQRESRLQISNISDR